MSSRGEGGGERGGRRRKRRELSDEQKQEITEAFSLFDSDKDGAVDYHELKVTSILYFPPETMLLWSLLSLSLTYFSLFSVQPSAYGADYTQAQLGAMMATYLTVIDSPSS